jgi:hypothetical protein
MLRVEGERLLVGGDRLVQAEAVLQDDPEVAVPVGAIGLERQAPLDQRDRVVAMCLLMCEDAREVQGGGMVGSNLEDAAVDLRGRRPLLGLLERNRDRQRLVDTERPVVSGLRRATTPACST